jgi:guanylate kinase
MGTANGQLIVLSGPSGSGKTTLGDRLERDYGCEYVVTATTRPPRAGERPGVDYQFMTREEFERRLAAGEFLEHAVVHGNLYGTPRRAVEDALARGATLILEIDTQGADNIRKAGIPHRSVFIQVPDEATLERRLRARRTDSEDDVAKRLGRAREEIAEGKRYDYEVVNADLDRAVVELALKLGLKPVKQ